MGKILDGMGHTAGGPVEVPFIDAAVLGAEMRHIAEEVVADPPVPSPAVTVTCPPPVVVTANVRGDRKVWMRGQLRESYLELMKIVRSNGLDPDEGEVVIEGPVQGPQGENRLTLNWKRKW